MSSNNQHEIVILGGNFAGLGVAHYLLKHTLPALSQLNPSITYRVTLISPSTHSFFKVSAPRNLVSTDLIPFSKVFHSIPDGFKEYSPDQFKFIQGTATNLDAEQKIVTISTQSTTKTTSYSTLVIATGTSANTALWTLNGPHDLTMKAMEDMHRSLPLAKTIFIAGGGPAGTETAGEIGTLYPNAKTTILSGTSRLLPHQDPGFSKDAESRLKQMGIEVVHNLRVSNVKEGKQTELTFDDGSTRIVDVYIDSTGGKPNSSFLPSSWLNERGYVLNDDKTLRLTVPNTNGVYVIGDVGSYSAGVLLDVNDGVAPLCSSIHIDLAPAKSVDASKERSGLLSYIFPSKSALPKQKYFKHTNYHLVPIGPKGGVGQFMGYRVPNMMVHRMKAKTFMVEKAGDAVKGVDFLAA